MNLARRLKNIRPSPTLALNAKAKALLARGVDVVSFAAGEPDFDTPQFIKDAAMVALRDGFTKYTATGGIPELKTAICEKLKRENRLQFSPENVLVSVGAKHSLYNLFQALLSEGDEVIIFAPYWVSYPDMVQLAGGTPIILPTHEKDGYAPDPELLKRALSSNTKAVILNSPSNPTGAVLSSEALTRIANVLVEHDCLVVTDDIYEKLLFVSDPFANIANIHPELAKRTLVVNGFSKAFSMTGWRLGYAAGPQELISAMQMIQDQSTSNPTSFAQKGAVAALNGPTDALQHMVSEFKSRRDFFVQGLNSLSGIQCRMPEGAFYVFPNVTGILGKSFRGQTILGSVHLSELLLEHFQLAAVPGLPFGAEGYLRLSFATSKKQIEKGLLRLKEFVSELR